MVCITPSSPVTLISQKTPWCASHPVVKLQGVHNTAESSSTVCIPPQSQAPQSTVCIILGSQALWCESHRVVKLHTKEGQSGEILIGVNTSIMKDKIWITNFLLAKPKILTPWCHAHCGVKFFELCDQISRRNRNQIRKYFSLFIRAQMGSNHEKNEGQKSEVKFV